VVAKVREKLAVSKKAAQKFDTERFTLKKINELEVWRTLSDCEDINRAWENIKENIKTSAK
jgi:hypothetical protein